MKRRQTLRRVYRVRGYDDYGNVRFSRMYAQHPAAVRLYRRLLDYYPRATLEQADVGAFTELEERPWW